MNYGQFLYMIPEATLVAFLVILFIEDFCSARDAERKWLNPFASICFLAQTIVCLLPTIMGNNNTIDLFGSMYHATPAVNMMKAILTFGTFIVVLQSRNWLNNTESKMVEGEFYMLTASTLLGMYMMMSAGVFLMFFLCL